MTSSSLSQTMEAGDFYSKAVDFLSCIMGDVDPRTGTYTVRINFTTGEGNRLRGPNFVFTLAYGALSTVDYGFGAGWRLLVTEYSHTLKLLSLSSGDTHKVDSKPIGIPCEFPDRKLESFRFTILGGNSAIVEHATGVIEHLEAQPGNSDILRTVSIVNPSGDAIAIEWGKDKRGNTALQKVTDDDGNVLLSIDYINTDDISLTIPTGLEQPLIIRMMRTASLQSISIPLLRSLNATQIADEDEASWSFQYISVSRLTFLAGLTSPDGIREEVKYLANGLRLPAGAPLDFMPLARELRRFSARNPQTIFKLSTYDYQLHGNANCYGYGLVQRWENRNDQLIHRAESTHYRYGSTETQYDEYERVAAVIEREYDNFHFATKEKTTRGHVTQITETTYGVQLDASFGNQSKNFELPRSITTTLFDERYADIKQIVVQTNTYTEDGDLLTSHDSSTDITETSDYYPVHGEMNEVGDVLCPPDPIGLVRRLKSKKVISSRATDPVLTTSYRYCAVPVKSGTSARLADRSFYVQACQETLTENDMPSTLTESRQGFYEDQGPQHGALKWETRTQDGLTERREFFHEQAKIRVNTIRPEKSGPDIEVEAIRTTTIHRTHDGIETSSSETKRLLSGLVASSTDALKNITITDHDALARVVAETHSPDNPDYATTTRWDYQVASNERWIRRIGITGLHHCTWLDERGQAIRQDEPLPDNTLMTVNEASFDIFGRPIRQSSYDLLGTKPLVLRTTTDYDDWGQACRVTHPDGSVSISERAVVILDDKGMMLEGKVMMLDGALVILDSKGTKLDGEVMMRSRQWQEMPDPDSGELVPVGAMQVVFTDAAGKQRRVNVDTWIPASTADIETRARDRHPRLHLLPQVEAAGTWTYDGLGRCIEQTDAMGQATLQSWDSFGRLLTTTLPNGDIVSRTYAKGQEAELLARIGITPVGEVEIEIGTRDYDGLGRLVSETAGSLTHTFSYTDGQMSHDHHVLPGKGAIRRSYDWRLGETVTREWLVAGADERLRFVNDRQAGDAARKLADYDPKAGDIELRAASYDTKLGLPSLVRGQAGQMTIRNDYLGRMTAQTQVYGDDSRESRVDVSPGGLELQRHGVDGVIQALAYDDVGRVKSITDAHARVTLTYDGLSRLVTRSTSDPDGQRRVLQRLGYDRLGRVASTVWEHDDHGQKKRYKLMLHYRPDNKVISKHGYGETDADLQRTETMDYDLRGRLVEHRIQASGKEHLPVDEQGNPYGLQRFRHDAIDNIKYVETYLDDGTFNVTQYIHDARDRDRVMQIVNSHPGYPTQIDLTYDPNGNLTSDGLGHHLTWDDAGRLTSVTKPDGVILQYRYGPNGRIAQVVRPGNVVTTRYHDNGHLYLEVTGSGSGGEERRFIRSGAAVVAESRLAGAIRTTWLLCTDPQGSVMVESGREFGVSPSGAS